MEKNQREIDESYVLIREIVDQAQALVDLEETVSLDHKNAEALKLSGNVKFLLQQYESALEDLNAADRLVPNDEETIQCRAQVYVQLKRLCDAYVDFSLLEEMGSSKCNEELKEVIDELLKGVPYPEFQDVERISDKGSYGQVYRAQWSGKKVALKCLKEGADYDLMIIEALICMKFRHENVVTGFGLCKGEDGKISFIMEYAEDGSLRDLLYERKEELTLEKKLLYAHDVASGLAYLHQRRVIHRDLKSANILLFDQKSRAKIADFGHSRLLNYGSNASSVLGTLGYVSPEILAEAKYDERADIYSFGVVLYEMCVVKTLPIVGEEERMRLIQGNVKDEVLRKLIMDCCKTDPKQRPAIRECVERIAVAQERLKKEQKLADVREDCRVTLQRLLCTWNYLSTSMKRSIVIMFLSMKYDSLKPGDDGKFLPADFAFKEEFNKIVESMQVDVNKARQLSFMPVYMDVNERAVAPAQVLLDNTTAASINILLIGYKGIGKSCFAHQFCRATPEQRDDANFYRYSKGRRGVQIIEPEFQFSQKEKTEVHRSRIYRSFVDGLALLERSEATVVVFCIDQRPIERWQRELIKAISDQAKLPIMIVQLQYCSENEYGDDIAILKKSINNNKILSYHAVLAKDKTINGQTIYAFGMHDLARAIAKTCK